ncbi:MAG: hypothetical protein ACR2K3_05945, partial [Nocardioides sp.]
EQLAGVEVAAGDLAGRAFGLLPASRRVRLSGRATLDLDSTDVGVYGSRKQGVAYNYAGQRAASFDQAWMGRGSTPCGLSEPASTPSP